MHSRLPTYCSRIIEAGWLAAVAVAPLHFNPTTSRIFEPDKIALLRSIAVVMVAAWLVKTTERWISRSKNHSESAQPVVPLRNGIILSAFFFLAVTALATWFSVLPHVSLWGYFGRLAGLYTTATYLVFFFAILTHLRTHAQLQRLVTTILLTSLPIALYGLIQHLGTDPITWTEAADGRIRSTMGYPAMLAATLALAVPLTLLRLLEARQRRQYLLLAAYLTLLGVQLAAILFTRSRGPVLGLTVGLFLGGLIWTLLQQWRRTSLALIGGSVVLVGFLVLINLPNSPVAFVQDVPYLDRLTRIADPEGSSEGRVLIWEGTTDLIAEKPQRLLLGYGPDTIRFVLYPHYTADLGRLHGWGAFVDRTHSEMFDVVVTTGVFGLICYLLLVTSIVYYSLRWLALIVTPRQHLLFLSFWVLGGLLAVLIARWIGQTWAFSGVVLSLGLLTGLFCYLVSVVFSAPKRTNASGLSPHSMALTVALLGGILAHFVETNVGISASATSLLFWIYTALLTVIGVFFRRPLPDESALSSDEPVFLENETAKSKLPVLSLLVGLLLVTLAYGFLGFNTTPTAWGLIGATWLLGGMLLFSHTGQHADAAANLFDFGIYAALSPLPLLLFAWLTTNVFETAPTQLLLYYGTVIVILAGIAGLLTYPATSPRRFATRWGMVMATVTLLGATWMIYQTNVQVILASVYHQNARRAFQQRQYDQAATAYREALAHDPAQALYQLEYAQLLATKAHYRTPQPAEREQLFKEAEQVLQDAMIQNPYEQYHPAALGEVYRLWAQMLPVGTRRTERYAKAVAAYDAALAINSENVLLWRQATALYEEMGDTDRIRDAYEHLLAWDSTNTMLSQRLANLYRIANNTPRAAELYAQALRHTDRPLPAVHHTLATLYAQMERMDEAIRESEHAVSLDASVPAYYHLLIGLYLREGRCAEALERTRAALQRWPNDNTLQKRRQEMMQQCPAATKTE